jgi:3-hydroxyacyl-CoA dehydrogenase
MTYGCSRELLYASSRLPVNLSQTQLKEIKRVNKLITGVVGAGVMGTGVAQSLAQAGHQVLLVGQG